MIPRSTAWRKAAGWTQASYGQTCKRTKGSSSGPSVRSPRENERPDLTSHYVSISQDEKEKRSRTRDFLISTLESSPTKRDAKQYLQTFGSKVNKGPATTKALQQPQSQPAPNPGDAPAIGDGIRAVYDSPKFVQPGRRPAEASAEVEEDDTPHIAIAKLKDPQALDDATLGGIAKTFAQLRTLGMPCVIVVDCGSTSPDGVSLISNYSHQMIRLAEAVDSYGEPWTRIVDSALSVNPEFEKRSGPLTTSGVVVDLEEPFLAALGEGTVILVPSYALSTDGHKVKSVDANEVILALSSYVSGLQFPPGRSEPGGVVSDETQQQQQQHAKKALVDRIIVLDQVGGIPARNRHNAAHIFLNMEDELEAAKADIEFIFDTRRKALGESASAATEAAAKSTKQQHLYNLELAKNTLAILPPTSSALITTPQEAANLPTRDGEGPKPDDGRVGFVGSVGTRKRLNPLIHNLLTDRPVYSSSLPLGRIKTVTRSSDSSPPGMSATTLAKRGMPVTIFPDPRVMPWVPPQPGAPRRRLTDTDIDLPRLVYLINDSFNRKLDVQHYLDRVNDNLAGVIIAGEYEGGAILTWEKPAGVDTETAWRTGRLVPYLDKFAVLKKSQGTGGVADMVFNAMVWHCFPDGVCWRSRRDNPVNKWYFERSKGTWTLDGSNWAMFWTTPFHALSETRFEDYQDVCRNLVPSWADKKKVVD